MLKIMMYMNGMFLLCDLSERVMDYESLKVFDIERFVKTSDSILVPGCGNSSSNFLSPFMTDLTRDMYTDGYHSITAIDISDVVIQKNRKRDRDIPLIRCTANSRV